MTETNPNMTRRKFMMIGSAAMAAPFAMKMNARGSNAEAAEKTYRFVEEKSCDLVVMGGGGSGLVAAVRAAQVSGRKVIVLEKDKITGGGARSARTIRTFGSKWQARRGIPDTTAAYAREMMEWMYWWLDEKLVGNCLHGTGRFFDWLCEEGGDIEDRFSAGKYVFAVSENDPVGPQMAGLGKFVMDMMAEKCRKYGVEVLTGHPVVDVEVRDGKIAAAIAKSDAGYVRVGCRACVLATGSWIRNEEIKRKYVPEYYAVEQFLEKRGENISDPGAREGSTAGHTSPNYTGDGIALAEKVGALVDYDSFCVRPLGPLAKGGGGNTFRAMVQSPFIVTVNLDGRRYASEPVAMNMGFFNGGSVLVAQPGAKSWDIFNEDGILAAFKQAKSPESRGKTQKAVEIVPEFKATFPDTMEEVQNHLSQTRGDSTGVVKAGTLAELADRIGVDKKNFLETIRSYNEGCKKGRDSFFKDRTHLVPLEKPPYYAVEGTFETDGAFGGVLVNHEMQAYRPDGKLVEGLYVTGDFASCRHVNVRGVKWQVLNDLSWAFSSGFLAGTNVVVHLQRLG